MNLVKNGLLGLGLFAMTVSTYGAVAPFFQDFDSGTASGFATAGTVGAYTVQSESVGYSYQAALSASTGSQSASSGTPVTNLSTASFIVSTDFKITSLLASGSSVANGGLGLFSDTADFSSGSQYRLYYQVTGGSVGKLQLMRNSTVMAVSTAMLPPRLNVNYTLSAVVSYDAGAITIRGILYDESNTISVLAIDNAPFQGAYFGYRTAISAANAATNITIRYDNLDISLGNGSQPNDGVVAGNLQVGGTVDIGGNSVTLGVSGNTFAAGLIYDASNAELTFKLTQSSGAWNWQRGSVAAMTLDAQDKLSLGGGGVLLDPNGLSDFGSVRVRQVLTVGEKVRVPESGDLSMGDFRVGVSPAGP